MTRADAAVELLDQFARTAARLCPGDPSTQDDLVQHMCLAVLECEKADERPGYYAIMAECRARDMLREKRVRDRQELKERAVAKRETLRNGDYLREHRRRAKAR